MARQRINPGAVQARLAAIMDELVTELGSFGEALIRVDRDGDFYIDRADDPD